MSVVFAGWMLIGSLLPGFGIDQAARLGDLVQHYRQHRREAPDLSLVDFLAMHYKAGSEHLKNPGHSHHNLPVSGHPAPIYTPAVVRLVVPALYLIQLVSTANFSRQADMYSFLAEFALINPPRA